MGARALGEFGHAQGRVGRPSLASPSLMMSENCANESAKIFGLLTAS
jgi:hypothetical protein